MQVMSPVIVHSDKLLIVASLACEVLQFGLWDSAAWPVRFCNLTGEVLQFDW